MWQDTANNWFQYRSNPDRQSHRGFFGTSVVMRLFARCGTITTPKCKARICGESDTSWQPGEVLGITFHHDAVAAFSLLRFGKMFTGTSQTIACSCCKLHKQVVEPGSMCPSVMPQIGTPESQKLHQAGIRLPSGLHTPCDPCVVVRVCSWLQVLQICKFQIRFFRFWLWIFFIDSSATASSPATRGDVRGGLGRPQGVWRKPSAHC